jgi:hypothetical protein
MGTNACSGLSRGVLLCLFAAVGCSGGTRHDKLGDGGGLSASDGGSTADTGVRAGQCIPGAKTCANGQATFCRDDGTLAQYECDTVQGMTCTTTGCRGACDLSEVVDSYIGCDYYPTVTLNSVWSSFSFAVAVSNTSSVSTHVTITRGSTVVQQADLAANQLQTFDLPWVPELKGGDITCTTPPAAGLTRTVAAGAYRVRTDRPVTVYQFSPLEYQLDPAPATCPTIKGQCAESVVEQCYSYSNACAPTAAPALATRATATTPSRVRQHAATPWAPCVAASTTAVAAYSRAAPVRQTPSAPATRTAA